MSSNSEIPKLRTFLKIFLELNEGILEISGKELSRRLISP